MKKAGILLVALFLFLGLWGCEEMSRVDTRLQVCVEETPGCTVENNGQWILPGERALFVLDMVEGYSLAGTDYTGAYSITENNGKLELILEDVQYPLRITLTLTEHFATVLYEPNGGDGDPEAHRYGFTQHPRPNTSIGTDLYFRDGHTLVCWNTEPDGSGDRIGLGSRVSAEETVTLFAQWAPWTAAEEFQYRMENGSVTIDAYLGNGTSVVVPAQIDGYDVTEIGSGAFAGSSLKHIVLPNTILRVLPGAFRDSTLETVVLFDNVQMISDDAFADCADLQTLFINAIEAPYGYDYRKESVYADKIDLLIEAQGSNKVIFYGGCSAWYNLDGDLAQKTFNSRYRVINMGLNGTVSSAVQLQILSAFLEPGDVLVHAGELTSETQLMTVIDMGEKDDKLWCGLEYNYDLVSLLDLRTVSGVFDSFCNYLSIKNGKTDYRQIYEDSEGRQYLDSCGSIPFARDRTAQRLTDPVRLNPEHITKSGMERLEAYYDRFHDLGVAVYVTYACVNMDEVPAEERGNVSLVHGLVEASVGAMDSAVLISELADYLYMYNDFYDTNYHLISSAATENTEKWLRDIEEQMVLDGIWNAE